MRKYRASCMYRVSPATVPAPCAPRLDEQLRNSGLPNCQVVAVDIDAPGWSRRRASEPRASPPAAKGNAGGLLLAAAAAWAIWFFWWMLSGGRSDARRASRPVASAAAGAYNRAMRWGVARRWRPRRSSRPPREPTSTSGATPSGARHFTNSKQGVPAEYQDRAAHADRRMATARPPRLGPVRAAAGAGTGRRAGPRWCRMRGATPTLAGVRAGMELGGGVAAGGGVQINGPLAVATSRAQRTLRRLPGRFYPPWPWYYPFVTTSFDRGRSRHQTLRMLLQDQFQLDRDGPYAYDRWNQPGLGPALAPFLPRGLPYGVGQYGRVIYR